MVVMVIVGETWSENEIENYCIRVGYRLVSHQTCTYQLTFYIY